VLPEIDADDRNEAEERVLARRSNNFEGLIWCCIPTRFVSLRLSSTQSPHGTLSLIPGLTDERTFEVRGGENGIASKQSRVEEKFTSHPRGIPNPIPESPAPVLISSRLSSELNAALAASLGVVFEDTAGA
jgi:hypothetical protein